MVLRLDVLANTRQFVSEMKKSGASVDDITEALDEMARDGDQATEKLERSFKDLASEASRTGKKVGTDLDDGFDKAKRGADDFKQEANSTAREAAASFDGSAESIGDAFQEIAANAFSGFGPAGAVAGLAAAAGIGLAVSAFNAVTEAQELSEQRISEWAEAFVEAGGKFLTAGVMAARAQDIITDSEKFKEAEKNARDWGVSIETAISAMSGSDSAINEVKAAVELLGDAYDDARKKAPAVDEFGQINAQLFEQEQGYRTAADSLGKLTGEMTAGQKRAQILNRYYEDLINSTKGVTKEVDKLGNELYSLPDGTQVYVDAETRQASQNVAKFKGDVDGIPEKVTTKVRVTADTSHIDQALRRLRSTSLSITGNVVYRAVGGGRFLE